MRIAVLGCGGVGGYFGGKLAQAGDKFWGRPLIIKYGNLYHLNLINEGRPQNQN